MNLPKATALSDDEMKSDEDKRPKLRIIKVKKKKNIGELDLNETKKKKTNNWKQKKENLKKMMNIDLLMVRDKKTVYDQNRTVPREIHELNDNTDDELFLKIESGSVSTINSEVSTRSKLETKLKNTKDKYLKYQTKAINKLKNLMPKSRSNENLKFMTASDLSKSKTLVPENRSTKRPPRPPLPKNYSPNKCLINSGEQQSNVLLPPIRPMRRKSKRSISSLNSSITNTTVKTNVPASVYYRQLREGWLERHGSKSNLSSICSTSIPNCSDRKFSFSTNQSMLSDDNFRYRYRADFHQSNQLLNANAAEKQSIRSEPTYTIVDGLPPKAPLRKRLTVSSYLSGSNLSLHRKLNSDYFNAKTDRSEQAVDALFWKPFSYKTNRVRSLTALYIRKNESPVNSNSDQLDRRIDELNKIYCMPNRPPLPVRFRKRQPQNELHSTSHQHIQQQHLHYNHLQPQQQFEHNQQSNDQNLLRPNQYTNLHEVYTVRDAIVGPNSVSYGEKEIQTSLEDFHDLDYDDEYETSPRFIDSSTNEFESLSNTLNQSDNEDSDGKIKKQLKQNLEDLNLLNELKRQQEQLKKELDAEIKQREFKNEFYEKHVQSNLNDKIQTDKYEKSIEQAGEQVHNEETTMNDQTKEEQKSIGQIESIQKQDNHSKNDESTLNDECTYVTVHDTSRTIGTYLDAQQDVQRTNETKNESTYVTLDYETDPFDTDTLADLDSLADTSLTGYLTPMNANSSSSLNNTIPRNKPKRTKRKSQLRNSGLDSEDDDEITDEIICIAANLQKELKQLVEK